MINTFLADGRPPLKVARAVPRNIAFFKFIEENFPRSLQLNAPRLYERLGAKGIRRNLAAYEFLVRVKQIAPLDAEEAELIVEEGKCLEMLADVAPAWKRKALQQYYQYLQRHRATLTGHGWTGRHERFAPRSVTLSLRAAKRLLVGLPDEIVSLTALEQEHVDTFLAARPGQMRALHSFVRYLKSTRQLFQPIVLGCRGGGQAPVHNLLTPSHSAELLRTWLAADDAHLKSALIGLFMLLYARTATQATSIRMDTLLKGPDGKWRTKFAKVWLTLDERLGVMLDRYLKLREAKPLPTDGREQYLFPGAVPGRPLSAYSACEYLRAVDVSAEQVFATSIMNAYRNGLRFPKTLVNALGVSIPTAVRYHQQFDSKAAKVYARRQRQA